MSRNNAKIKKSFSIVAHGPNVVELRQGIWNSTSFTLTDDSGQGRLLEVVKALDGSRDAARVAKDLGLKTAEVQSLLDHLTQLGALETTPGSAMDYYIDEAVPALRPVLEEKTLSQVVLLGDAEIVQALRAVLDSSLPEGKRVVVPEASDRARAAWEGANVEELLKGLELEGRARELEVWRDSLVVYCQRTIRPDQATTLNRLALAAKVTWLSVAVDGPFLFIGPTFEAKYGACYECLDTRVLMNMRQSEGYQRYKMALATRQVTQGELPILPAMTATLAGHAAMEICNKLVAGANFTSDQMLSIYLPTLSFSFHEVLKLPGCPACGSSPENEDHELYFDMRALVEGGTP
jgi:bacteriocin biosynthesis cyclodehydratase domain-containing protein